MHPNRRSRPALTAIALAITALLMVAGGALAAGTTLSLEVKGQYAKLHRTACHKTKSNWRAFHRASTIEYRGFLIPAPASRQTVRLKIEKCVAGRWRDVRDYHVTAESTADTHPGRFKAFYPARPLAPRARNHRAVTAYYRARAIDGAATSPEAYFLVTSS